MRGFDKVPTVDVLGENKTIIMATTVNLSFAAYFIYTASKVKHRLNMFLENKVKLSKHVFIPVSCTFMKIDKVVTIYRKF